MIEGFIRFREIGGFIYELSWKGCRSGFVKCECLFLKYFCMLGFYYVLFKCFFNWRKFEEKKNLNYFF